MSDLSEQQKIDGAADTLAQPEGSSLQQWMETRIARYATRKYDWDALKFQADLDPKFRRAQMRYVGTGGTEIRSRSVMMVSKRSPSFSMTTLSLPRIRKNTSSTSVCRCGGPSWPAGITMVEKVKFSAGTVFTSLATPVPPVPT